MTIIHYVPGIGRKIANKMIQAPLQSQVTHMRYIPILITALKRAKTSRTAVSSSQRLLC